MKNQKPLPFISGALLLSASFVSIATPSASAQTAGFASQVVDYTAGTGISSTYTNAGSALGKPGGNVGSGTLNPFVSNFAGSELTGIGIGGQLTLSLPSFVGVGAAGMREIGVFGNVSLVNSGTAGAPAAANPATEFGVRSVLISVSADGTNFIPLNNGALITSTLPVNYYTNPDTTNINAAPPANPTFADFGKPFTGSLADFNGQTYAQTLTTLNGSAGGTWLDLSSTGLSQVGFIRFSEPATATANGGIFYLNGVSSNSTLTTGVAVVPEPGALMLLTLGGALALIWCRGWRDLRRTVGVTALGTLMAVSGFSSHASAQMFNFSDIKNWTGTGSNQAAMVVDWHDGKTPESIAWGYRFDGAATGLQMLQAIDAADPRLAVFFAYGGSFTYGFGYDLNNNGGTFTPGTPGFDNGGNSTETGFSSDAADHYAEGVYSKFWGYDIATGSPYGGGGTWNEAPVGADTRQLVNGSWDGWSLSFDESNFTVPDPGFPTAAVPEPSSRWTAIIALAALGLVARLRRRLPKPALG